MIIIKNVNKTQQNSLLQILMSVFPSGVIARQLTISECPMRVRIAFPVLRFQIFIALKEEFKQLFDQAENLGDGMIKLLDWLVKAAQVFPKSGNDAQSYCAIREPVQKCDRQR